MGAYAPFLSRDAKELAERVSETIMQPVLQVLRDRGTPFTGLLYAGLMLTADGPKVIEFNCRFGDPETEAIIAVDRTPLAPLLHAVAVGDRLPDRVSIPEPSGHAVTTVVAAAGYPEQPRTGDVITLPPLRDGLHVFHAGTARSSDGTLVTAGGRVLAITAVAPTLAEAQRRSADYSTRVVFAGKQFRTDIAGRALRREERWHSPHDARAS